ncbi:MAG: undecaprenyl-diphosphate phosphatase [Candidatus Omnitrophica bacterium]|nr:undecaprenyl-diphosphate phosphatase [Candidatus Omnitrophota bacterium]
MNIWGAIASGVLQGVTEFLPVSSSAHLAILHNYLGYKEPQILFDIFLHIGTLFAVLVYFRKDIVAVFSKEKRVLFLVLISSIPTAAIGVLFKPFFEESFVNIKLIAVFLLINAFLLFTADLVMRLMAKSKNSNIGFLKAFIIGTVQGAAILPGLSRSGTTISAALILNVKKADAVRYSFLLAIPAILGALIFKLNDIGSFCAASLAPFMAGALASFFIGLAAISILIKSVTKNKLYLFGVYCFLVGSVILVLK